MGQTGARVVMVAVQASLLVAAGPWRGSPGAVAAEPDRSAPRAADAPRAEDAGRPLPECFLVTNEGSALLGADGAEIERLDPITNAWGALSRDGRWVAYGRSAPGLNQD